MLMLLLLYFQEVLPFKPEPIHAKVTLENGKEMELINIRVRGPQPYVLSFYNNHRLEHINLLSIHRITRLGMSRYEVLYDNGEKVVGDLKDANLIGVISNDLTNIQSFSLFKIKVAQFILAYQLRSCEKGHYEKRTPYPYCPVCGDLLTIGPWGEEPEETMYLPREHQLRSDPRHND